MKMKYYKIEIDHMARNAPQIDRDKDTRFDKTVKTFKTKNELENYIFDRYGSNVLRQRDNHSGVYVNTNKGTKQVGVVYSFWNRDWSHNSKRWWQTDWIVAYKVDETKEYLID